ncbi:MAG: glycosyltransferase family 4 protein, partial [bacterium]
GGGTAVRGLLRHLSRRHTVLLVCLVRPDETEHVAELSELGLEVRPIPFLDRRARGKNRLALAGSRGRAWLRSLHTGYPLYVEKYWSRTLSRQVIDAVRTFQPDAIQVEYLQLALLVRDLRRWRETRTAPNEGRPRLILNTHELGSLPRRRRQAGARHQAARLYFRSEAAAWERLQLQATRWADVTLCVTEQDRQLLAAQGGKGLMTMPLGMDLEAIEPVWREEGPAKFLFVGSFAHGPNQIAAKFLVDKVWPQVAQCTPTGQLILAGPGSDDFIAALDRQPERVSALGFVEDLTALFQECRLFVAPLTEGGGIKIKILEAMARGIPVVTTPIGAEGIVDPAEDALVIAQPDATFAESMIEAIETPDLMRRRAKQARQIIEQRFSWSAITEKLTSIYEGR